MNESDGAAYWARRMDKAMNRDDFLAAWDEWWKHAIGPHARLSTTKPQHTKPRRLGEDYPE